MDTMSEMQIYHISQPLKQTVILVRCVVKVSHIIGVCRVVKCHKHNVLVQMRFPPK